VKVLVVEDDRKTASFLGRVLLEEGYVVDSCADGRDALVQGATGVYDLVLLDWMLPEFDGPEVCRHLRRLGCGVPILMLTAHRHNRASSALNAGADDYLAKPFEVDELVARVKALVRRSTGSARLKVGPLEIDRSKREARVAGKCIELTDREFPLLAHLMRNAGRIVTRADLMAQVWPSQFDADSNIVEVNISRLRAKLGACADMLETIRGRGYRLIGSSAELAEEES
jgi:DNA-binding response OmpR family regulator